MTQEMRLLLVLFVTVIFVGCVATTQKITFKSGKTYEVVPLRYNSQEITVRAVGISAPISPGKKVPWMWRLQADLKEAGEFNVTVATPIDEKLSTTFEVKGPGVIDRSFFPEDRYPTIWEDIEKPGIHWFPFHFSFEEKTSKKRFDFTQWAYLDSKTVQVLLELIKRQ